MKEGLNGWGSVDGFSSRWGGIFPRRGGIFLRRGGFIPRRGRFLPRRGGKRVPDTSEVTPKKVDFLWFLKVQVKMQANVEVQANVEEQLGVKPHQNL